MHIEVARANQACVMVLERFTGMSAARWRILHYLDEHSCMTQKELVQRSGFDSWTVTRTVKPLEAEGLIERSHDPDDNRVTQVRLSEKGRRFFREAEARRKQFLRQAFKSISEEEIKTLTCLLQKVEQCLVGEP